MPASSRSSPILITGANGQDGRYLLEALSASSAEIHGLCRSAEAAEVLSEQFPRVHTHVGDLADSVGIDDLVHEIEPLRIVNLAGNTSVERSWRFPTETADILGVGPVRLLHAAWNVMERTSRPVRFLQASSAEIFGDAVEVPQRESTPRRAVTPYGAAKSFAHEMVSVYRDRGLFASAAILYNHESPRRPETFVARKISREVARISLGLSDDLTLGNMDVYRDWGYAPDFVEAMLVILEADLPGDYVVATGVAHSVRQFVEVAFDYVGIADWERYVHVDRALYRPSDPRQLVGDPARIRRLGWSPSVDFEQLVRLMVDADLTAVREQRSSDSPVAEAPAPAQVP